jgi:hypothetical protein
VPELELSVVEALTGPMVTVRQTCEARCFYFDHLLAWRAARALPGARRSVLHAYTLRIARWGQISRSRRIRKALDDRLMWCVPVGKGPWLKGRWTSG